MMAWIFFLLTLGCAWLYIDALRLKSPLGDELKVTDDGKSRFAIEGFSAPFGLGVLAWLFLVMTVLLGVLTVREFIV